MIKIKPDCTHNAIGMLLGRFSRYLGWVGVTRYYIVDGVAWSRKLDGTVYRAETPEESEQIIAMVKGISKQE